MQQVELELPGQAASANVGVHLGKMQHSRVFRGVRTGSGGRGNGFAQLRKLPRRQSGHLPVEGDVQGNTRQKFNQATGSVDTGGLAALLGK